MAKRQESSADRIWKEKLDGCGSTGDALALLIIVVLIGALFIASSGDHASRLQSKEVERAIGIEPTTFSLGS